ERAMTLLVADVVLDVPELRVDVAQRLPLGFDVLLRECGFAPGHLQERQLGAHVRDLRGVGHACGFDFQDRDLVDQLARRDRNLDFGAHAGPAKYWMDWNGAALMPGPSNRCAGGS